MTDPPHAPTEELIGEIDKSLDAVEGTTSAAAQDPRTLQALINTLGVVSVRHKVAIRSVHQHGASHGQLSPRIQRQLNLAAEYAALVAKALGSASTLMQEQRTAPAKAARGKKGHPL